MSDPTASAPNPVPPPTPPPPWKRIRPRAILTVAACFLMAALLVAAVAMQPAGDGSLRKIVTIQPGSTAKGTAEKLHKSGLLRSPFLFTVYARLTGVGGAIKAGPYQLDDGMGPVEILKKLVAGEIYIWRFAVPEGYSIYQLAEMLAARTIVTREAFLAACADPALRKELGIAGPSVEGYLAPSTYDLTPGSDSYAIIRQMVRQFEKTFAGRFAGAALPGLTRHQVVTIASLVEKEAVVPGERPLIAAVFRNRLKKKMRLQSDPTAVYGVRAFGGEVSAADVRRPSPYNTYLIDGLPPGPIGNPSADAIGAVLAPAAVPYLYFVAKKDGSHHFSTTLDEHNRAVSRYLRNGR